MKKYFIGIVLLILFIYQNIIAQDLTKYVDPFIGTGGEGHTYPGAVLPFGMVQLSPDTRPGNWDDCSGYHYSCNSILGFSHLHLSGTGVPGYGDILFMPTTGKIQLEPGDEKKSLTGYKSKFDHSSEIAEPGYYSVLLSDYSIRAELTVTTRAGFHRYTYPSNSSANLIIDLVHRIQSTAAIKEAEFRIVDENKIEGMRRTSGYIKDHLIYFVAEFSKPVIESGIQNDGRLSTQIKEAKGTRIKAYLKFNVRDKEPLLIKVGISTVDYEGARKNLAAEISGWDFDKVRNDAKEIWNKQLSKIIVKNQSEDKKKIFYTALYHASVAPNIYFDVDRRYRGRDRQVHYCKDFDNYTAFSLWDTFRSTHPLYLLIDPERANNMVNSLLAKYDESGMLPKIEYGNNETGDMIGYHSLPVIADAYVKGIRGFDAEHALKAMVNSAYYSDPEMKLYMQLGYVPADKKKESVSKTIEYSYDDWTIYALANAVGDQKTANEFLLRSEYYRNLFNGYSGFFRGRNSSGDWVPEFDPFEVSHDFTEGNAWQYSLFAPHDMNGLINLYGGKKKFISHVDRLFSSKSVFTGKKISDLTGTIGQYVHGNEPSHHIAYVYNFVDQPWKTQERIHQLCKEMYTTHPDGLIGNDDCGQMSSWFIFSSMGFYPFCPGTDEYQIGAPFFDEVTLNQVNGKKFVIKTENLSDKNYYIQSAQLNGKELNVPFIKHSDIAEGGVLIFRMGSAPNKNWGNVDKESPYSLSKGRVVSIPYVKNDIGYFANKTKVELGCATDGAEIRYTLDGSLPDKNSILFKKPFTLFESAELKVCAFKDELKPSPVLKINAVKAKFEKAVDISEDSLINGVQYKYYEGLINSAYDIPGGVIKKIGNLKYFSLEPAEVKELYGFSFNGYIYIPDEQIYSFYTKSDDGSVLLIDNKEVVNNDGAHSASRAISNVIALSKGFHAFTLLYFNRYKDAVVIVGWGSKKISSQVIPAKYLFRKK
jgi:predicted alpha-1,2-mannosidase